MSKKYSDEIEVSFTEALNIFYRKRMLIGLFLVIGFVLSLTVAFLFISPSVELKLSYKIKPIKEVDMNYLGQLLADETRFSTFTDTMNLKRSQFYSSGGLSKTLPFKFEKAKFIEVQNKNELYNSFDIELNIKTKSLEAAKFIDAFGVQVVSTGFSEFNQKLALYDFKTDIETQKENLSDAVSELIQTIPFDQAVLDNLKRKKASSLKSAAPISVNVTLPTVMNFAHPDGPQYIEKDLTQKQVNFLGRYMLPIESQIQIVESILQDKVLKKEYLLKQIDIFAEVIEIAEQAIKKVPFNREEIDRFIGSLAGVDEGKKQESIVLFKEKLKVQKSTFLLTTPNAKAISNYENRLKVALIIFFISIIIAILSAFLSDFWDQNKDDIVKTR